MNGNESVLEQLQFGERANAAMKKTDLSLKGGPNVSGRKQRAVAARNRYW